MNRKAFSMAWEDVKHSPKWFGKMCLLALISFIPIFGLIAVTGYMTGWARDAAWGVRQPLPAKALGNADGRQYSRGFFVCVISIAYLAAASIVVAVLCSIAAGLFGNSWVADALVGFFEVAGVALMLFLALFVWAGALRTSIYGTFSAGFQLKKAWAMLCRDWGGILRILGMTFLFCLLVAVVLSLVFNVIAGIAGLFSIALVLPAVASVTDASVVSGAQYGSLLLAVLPMLIVLSVLSLAASYCSAVAAAIVMCVSWRAVGLWAQQLRVPEWRGQNDPMPFEAERAQMV